MKTLNVLKTLYVLSLAFILVPAFFVQSSSAFETSTDRPGMDYQTFLIDKNKEAFVAVKQCEDACQNDPKCKAFTYVQPGVQGADARCYLKKSVPSPVKNKGYTSGVVRPETKADYCNNYALTAVQFSISNKTGECGYTGDIWNEDYSFHYSRCMEVQESVSKHEADDRKNLMDQCAKPSRSGDLSAYNWCYDISTPQAFQSITITFHPIIKNVGKKRWQSEKDGKYFVGVNQELVSELISQDFTLSKNYQFKPGEVKILPGVTLPFHENNVYSLVSWNLLHNDDVNADNNEFIYNIVFYGADLMVAGRLTDMQCQNLENIISNTKTYTDKGCYPCNSKFGDVESDELNGIAHSQDYWFWSSNGAKRTVIKNSKDQYTEGEEKGQDQYIERYAELARSPRSSFSSVQKYAELPVKLKQKGYKHFGDLDFYDNLLYVPVTTDNSDDQKPIVAVFDENLSYKKYGKFPEGPLDDTVPEKYQRDAAWVAINPKDGQLYTHGESFNRLNVYDIHFSDKKDGETLTYSRTITLKFKHTPKYSKNNAWWNGVWQQGGAFSEDGIFYLVLDHKSVDYDENTGVHAFKIEGFSGRELTLRNGTNNFIHLGYDTETLNLGNREEELEGITVVSLANLDQVHVILLNNELLYDDQAYLFHYDVKITSGEETDKPGGYYVSSGTSGDLDAYRKPYIYKTKKKIVGMGITGSNDHVYAWYSDGTVSSGTSSDLEAYHLPYNYTLPSGKTPEDIVGMGIAGSNDHVYVWYKDGTVSSGTSRNLSQYTKPYNYSLPPGKTYDDIVGMGIAGSNDHVYAWYKDGTVSSGTSWNLSQYKKPYKYSLPPGKTPKDIVGMAIAGSNDHVYAWYDLEFK